MGIFDKLAFWKKDSDDDYLGQNLGLDQPTGINQGPLVQNIGSQDPLGMGNPSGMDPMGQQQGMNNPMGFSGMQESRQSQHADTTQQLLEVISSKLDAIKANMDSIGQRLENIERIAKGDRKGRW